MKKLLLTFATLAFCFAANAQSANELTDVLTYGSFKANGTGYQAVSYTSSTTNITYAAQMNFANNIDYIQLRATSPSGIVTTANPDGLILKSVTVAYTNNTGTNRSIKIYGNDANYSGTGDMYASTIPGTVIGTITGGVYTDQSVTSDGSYIGMGIKTVGGALYLAKIEVVWEKNQGDVNPQLTFPANEYEAVYGEGFTAPVATSEKGSTGAITYTSSNEDVATVKNDGSVTLVGAGQTVITATIAAVEGFTEGTATYTLTVYAPTNAPLYRLIINPDNVSAAVQDYVSTFDITSQEITWTAVNFNNNNNSWTYIRCGNKNNAGTATLTSQDALSGNLTQMIIDMQKGSSIATVVDKATVNVSHTNNFDNSFVSKEITEQVNAMTNSSASNVIIDLTEEVAAAAANQNYYFQLVFETPKYSSSNGGVQVNGITIYGNKATGIDSVMTDEDAAPVYYNLQGVRVNAPEKGLYIVVKGGKSSKVLF